MKKVFLVLVFCLIGVMAFALTACGGSEDGGGSEDIGGYEPSVSPAGIPMGETGVSPSAMPIRDKMTRLDGVKEGLEYAEIGDLSDDGEGETEVTNEQYQAGLITASAWDDNQYYEAWKKLFVKGQTKDEDGKFVDYVDNKWWLDTTKRVKVTVKEGENAVVGATVTYYSDDQTEYKAVTNAKGEAYLFTTEESGTLYIISGENQTTATFTAEERELSVDLAAGRAKDNVIKLMFVVDVTGSMGDELTYLKNELADVIRRVATNNAGVRIDLALLFYRDTDDDEKFAYAEFKTVSDNETTLGEQMAFLKKQEAMGGGDYPEAVDEAIGLAVGKDWGTENSTKMIFFVLDAPPHSESKNIALCGSSVKAAAAKGIRICPILCSGADSLTEYVARQGALYTGGTFVFVTDDSGIGGSHHDPDLPNAVVEKLNELIIRLINGYHSGTFAAPEPYNAEQTQSETETE